MNIWNYFSENVTALRMRDNCWGVMQRRSALPLATNGTQERGDGIQGEMASDARAAAEQQLVAFEGRGAVEVGVAGTGLIEKVLGNEAAQIHRLLVLTEPLHQLFALAVLHHLALALAKLAQHLNVRSAWPLGSSKNTVFPEFLFHIVA